MRSRLYDSAEFTLATGETNYQLSVEESAAFNNASLYTRVIIRTSVTITIKLNSASNPAITVGPTDSPFQIDWLEVNDIFITNSSGSTASIKMVGVE